MNKASIPPAAVGVAVEDNGMLAASFEEAFDILCRISLGQNVEDCAGQRSDQGRSVLAMTNDNTSVETLAARRKLAGIGIEELRLECSELRR